MIKFIQKYSEEKSRIASLISKVEGLKTETNEMISDLYKQEKKILEEMVVTHRRIISCHENGFPGVLPNVIRHMDSLNSHLKDVRNRIEIWTPQKENSQ
jgi:hypothetical protein